MKRRQFSEILIVGLFVKALALLARWAIRRLHLDLEVFIDNPDNFAEVYGNDILFIFALDNVQLFTHNPGLHNAVLEIALLTGIQLPIRNLVLYIVRLYQCFLDLHFALLVALQ